MGQKKENMQAKTFQRDTYMNTVYYRNVYLARSR